MAGLRVVTGAVGGRRLVTPPGRETRPTSERVREAVFNALGSMGVLDDATFLDLFAGSGALGVEALSRGAARGTFVDHDRAAVTSVQTNLAALELDGRADVACRDALAWLDGESARGLPGPVDLAFLDPPYAFDRWPELLNRLDRLGVRLVVIESDREVALSSCWEVTRRRRYGATVVTIACRNPAPERELT